jgi:hypothetical protein
VRGCRLYPFGSRHSIVTGSCEHGNELSDSIKDGKFNWLSDYKLLSCDYYP